SFTITGTTGVVCLPTAISNTAFAVASAFCGQQAVLSNPVGSDIQPPPAAGLVASEIQIGGGGTGSPLRYLLIVTNTGSVTVTDLTVTDTVSAVLVSQTTDQP